MRVEAVGSDGSHDEMNKNLHTGQIYKELNILYWAVEIGQRLSVSVSQSGRNVTDR